ncbi:hypothetical protein [Micromonospora sp. CPCC 206061]
MGSECANPAAADCAVMRRMPSVFTGASFGSALIVFGVWNIASSIRP